MSATMTPYQLLQGACLELMATIPGGSVGAGSASPTETLAALDALVLIEMPMRAAMQSAMIAQVNYQRDMALCKMQQAEAAENARIMELIFSAHSPNAVDEARR